MDRRYRRLRRERRRTVILTTFLIIVAVLLILIIGNQQTIMVMQTDILNQQNTIVLELDKQSIDDAAENRSEVKSEPLGTFTVTHYCPCEICCGKSDGITATGTQATEGRTIAVDPSVIPLGTEVEIDGHTYIAEDVGGAIKGNKVDIFVNDHETAIQRGKIQREVELVR
jgi:3D (Asp-Asp-Asp) domain-containing protein